MGPSNKSLDASGGSVLLNLLGAAEGVLIRAAASTQTLCGSCDMNNEEARSVLAQEMERYRSLPYSALTSMLDETKHIDITGPSGTAYQVDISVMWDEKSKGTLRVIGAVDDGGWHAFVPLTDDFILRADGTFVGE